MACLNERNNSKGVHLHGAWVSLGCSFNRHDCTGPGGDVEVDGDAIGVDEEGVEDGAQDGDVVEACLSVDGVEGV